MLLHYYRQAAQYESIVADCMRPARAYLEGLFSCNAGCMFLCSRVNSLLDGSLPSFAVRQLSFQVDHLLQSIGVVSVLGSSWGWAGRAT